MPVEILPLLGVVVPASWLGVTAGRSLFSSARARRTLMSTRAFSLASSVLWQRPQVQFLCLSKLLGACARKINASLISKLFILGRIRPKPVAGVIELLRRVLYLRQIEVVLLRGASRPRRVLQTELEAVFTLVLCLLLQLHHFLVLGMLDLSLILLMH